MPAGRPDRLRGWTLGDVLRENARSYPGRTAVVDGDVRLSYPELDQRVNRLANALAAAGLGRGQLVGWLGQTSFRALETLFAAAKLGAVCCPVNWRLSVAELVGLLDDARPAVLLWQRQLTGPAAQAARDRLSVPPAAWICHDDPGPDGYEARLAAAAPDDPAPPADPQAAVLQLYTAAFSGRPNGAVLSHTSLLLESLAMAWAGGFSWSDVHLNPGPLFHIGSYLWSLPTLLVGGTNVFTARADPEELCRLVAAERCTGAYLMPPTVQQMVAVNGDGRYDLTSLRSPRGDDRWEAMISPDRGPLERRRGGYGQTELTGLATLGAVGPPGAGAAGRPLPGVQLQVVDVDGCPLPAGTVGEIVVRGPTVMLGYHRRRRLTAQRQRDGWQHTTDLGRREADGSVTFLGPVSRFIKSAAENIYPAEVEACLRGHPAVADCAVLGVPDVTWGQQVKAVVVAAPGQEVDAADLIEHCRAHLASYKKPRSVEFTDALPRTGGLLDRDELDRRFGGGGYPGQR